MVVLAAFVLTTLDSGPGEESWRKKKKHIFLLTSAGKPIYSR
jgi:hypothetical protein